MIKKEWIWMYDIEEDYLNNIDKKAPKIKPKKLRRDKDRNEENKTNYEKK